MVDTARQKELFEAIHDQYYQSTTDEFSLAYKREFVFNRVLDLLGESASVIELASGTGATVGFLKGQRPNLEFAGCDISERAALDFREIHQKPCYVADLTKPFEPTQTFDAAIVMGGIHHLVADLDMAFANISKLLNPGGRLIMAEPNADYILEPIRKIWYRIDKSNFDSDNERALSHHRLFRENGHGFKVSSVKYFGGPAYYAMNLNWVLRIPNKSKEWMAPSLMGFERLFNRLPAPWSFAAFIAAWDKVD